MHENHTTIWDACLRGISQNISEQSFKTWFSPIIPIKLDGEVLTIQVPSEYFYEYLEEHFVHVLKEGIVAQLGERGKLEYSVVIDTGNNESKPQTVNFKTKGSRNPKTSDNLESKYSPFAFSPIDDSRISSNLNSQYTFDTYIEGDCNNLARSAGLAVARKPANTSFNPLMLYGGVGLGKTHLVQAIGNEIKYNYKQKFTLYVNSEKFTSQFIEAIKTNCSQEFSNFYLQVDTLILDDVQFLSGKEKTQEMFFHIFNHLHQSGKQIIMTSDCIPKDLIGFEERLLSRFKWGLTADLQQPNLETRMAIIHRKIGDEGIRIPDNVSEYLAQSVNTNIRELEGVLISLVARASLNRMEINLELAKQVLNDIVTDIVEVNIDYIQKTIADFFRVSIDQLKAKTRKKEIVTARQVAMYFSKEYTQHSLQSIGYHFGGRDHSTVIHAVQSVENKMDIESNFKSNVEDIRKKIKIRLV